MNQAHLKALTCVRCGTPLELPADPRAVHIDCPSCGQDNLMPQYLIDARRQQAELAAREQRLLAELAVRQQTQEKLLAEKAAQRRAGHRKFYVILILVLLVPGCGVIGLVGLATLGWYVGEEEKAQAVKDANPRLNGQARIAAMLEKKQAQGCARVLSQPTTYTRKAGTSTLSLIAGADCVHILAATGTKSALTMRYQGDVALTSTLPSPASVLDFRICAAKTADYAFEIKNQNPNGSFTQASIECPRKAGEGGMRSVLRDDATTGKRAIAGKLAALKSRGCEHVVVDNAPHVETTSLKLTLAREGQCIHALAASHFADVKLTMSVTNPQGRSLAVPTPGPELEFVHCPTEGGDYVVKVSSSTADHFATAAVDCNRNGPEGLLRERRGGPVR
ncbi:MAG: hypothetical protein JW751_29085 [Polyangiaceae bacterium]|nr:hypothetical protein [Polyangiaceae bacterium]